MNKTRKVIIAAAVVVVFAALLQAAAAESCKPNASGMCLLPKKAVAEEKAEECAWPEKLAGGFSGLCEQLVLKAKEAGKLLEAPQLAMELMENCGLRKEWDAFFSDYQKMLSVRKQLGIPYRKPVFACSEES